MKIIIFKEYFIAGGAKFVCDILDRFTAECDPTSSSLTIKKSKAVFFA
ncbi:MAG: hypothetical protein HOL75_01635 [Nitrospina sp.]|nr:hypothetical protein [Nitrospina sp.]